MEEQKIASKEVKRKPVVNEQASNQGDSLIEELQKWDKDKLIQQIVQMNQQLFNQDNFINKLKNQINGMNQFISNKRMEYLFKVVELEMNPNKVWNFNSDFTNDCINEIQEALSIPKEEKNNEVNKES